MRGKQRGCTRACGGVRLDGCIGPLRRWQEAQLGGSRQGREKRCLERASRAAFLFVVLRAPQPAPSTPHHHHRNQHALLPCHRREDINALLSDACLVRRTPPPPLPLPFPLSCSSPRASLTLRALLSPPPWLARSHRMVAREVETGCDGRPQKAVVLYRPLLLLLLLSPPCRRFSSARPRVAA